MLICSRCGHGKTSGYLHTDHCAHCFNMSDSEAAKCKLKSDVRFYSQFMQHDRIKGRLCKIYAVWDDRTNEHVATGHKATMEKIARLLNENQ